MFWNRALAPVLLSIAAGAALPAAAHATGTQASEIQPTGLERAESRDLPLAAVERGPITFREVPGKREFTGELIARPLSVDRLRARGMLELAANATRDIARGKLASFVEVDAVALRGERARVIRVPAGRTEADVAAELMATGAFEFVEPNYRVSPAECPNDPLLSTQWHHDAAHIDSCRGWAVFTGDPRVTIAIVDTGVLLTHLDLNDNRVEGYNSVSRRFESEGGDPSPSDPHGTRVAGMAAGEGDNGFGVAGVAPDNSYRPVRATNARNATIADILNGALASIERGDRVANLSWSGADSGTALAAATDALEMGGLFVYAAGNSNREMTIGDRDADDMLVVGGTRRGDGRYTSSNFGRFVDVVAPSQSVYTTNSNGSFTFATGTSFGAPIVAGLAGLLFAADPSLTPDEVMQIIKDSAEDLGAAGIDDIYGHGRINVGDAMELVEVATDITPLPIGDAFDAADIPAANWRDVIGPQLVETPARPGDPFAVRLDAGDVLATVPIDTLGLEEAVLISFDVAAPDAFGIETLDVRFPPFIAAPIALIRASELDPEAFTRVTLAATRAADRFGGQVRFEPASAPPGGWLIDNVAITEFDGIAITPFVSTFESGIDTVLRWDSITNAPLAISSGTPGQNRALRLSANSQMLTLPVNFTDPAVRPTVELILADADAAVGDLVLEAQNTGGAFLEIARVTAEDVAGPTAVPVSVPAEARTAASAVRLRIEPGSGSWLLEQFALGLAIDGLPCDPVDVAEPFGVLDASDLRSFVELATDGDAAADIDGVPGLSFFDVLEAVGAAAAGCP